jgi:hypothetical protein
MKEVIKQRISTFAQLGKTMKALAETDTWPGFSSGLNQEEFDSFRNLIETHFHSNGWFTPDNVRKSLLAWSDALSEANLTHWLGSYDIAENSQPKKVAVICAGNIPLVGLHDIITVLVTGNMAYVKLSSDDNKLIPSLIQIYENLNPDESGRVVFVDQKLTGHQAVIATGSNNTSRYFSYYFRDVPHVIRKSRTSVAILSGDESAEDLRLLGKDIFDYFGLGCRNVSKVYLPEGYDLNRIFEAIYEYNPVINHNKYANNYDYNKAVWLLNRENLLDNGFILLKEDKRIASPTASLFYEFYRDISSLRNELNEHQEHLQCIVGKNDIPFGSSQRPQLWDYADHVDTIKFLSELQGAG